MKYMAAAEVDKIQSIIFASDKLKEMIGASYLIDDTANIVSQILARHTTVHLLWRVSGVYKFGADDLNVLASALWEIRERLVDDLGLSVTFEIIDLQGNLPVKISPAAKPVKRIFSELDAGIRQQKDSRHGEDGSPSCPYFAPCRILPDEYANYWDSEETGGLQDRRALISGKAVTRRNTKPDKHGLPFIGDVLPDKKLNIPEDLDDLTVPGASDSYIAFIKGDGDRLGQLLSTLDWNDATWEKAGSNDDARSRPLKFSERLQEVFKSALREAITKTAIGIPSGKHFPILPLLLGGEDFWILSRRDFALPLVHRIGEIFSQKTKDDDFLRIAFQVGGITEITLSFGVLFAQKGYPFDQQSHLVDELLKEAKAYRRMLPTESPDGCVDFLWLDSSGRETVAQIRSRAYGYTENEKTFRLFSHPWTLKELEACRAALPFFSNPNISHHKLYQWRDILRNGDGVSVAYAHRWFASLESDERKAWKEGVAKLPDRLKPRDLVVKVPKNLDQGFWQKDGTEYVTAIQDLLELIEIGQIPSNIP
ncbi:MAG: hypothetical protein M1418_06565 [Deltaproteobacteria bacterium]|nr:hypothetical protein [Deltaproteobacteria bacterium]